MSTLYEELSVYIEKKMRMAAIHQPVMLMSLLINDGKRSDALMARDLLLGDEIQME
jgi:hypothetical protein